MPDFKSKMSDDQLWQTTLYVKHLTDEHPRGAGNKHQGVAEPASTPNRESR